MNAVVCVREFACSLKGGGASVSDLSLQISVHEC